MNNYVQIPGLSKGTAENTYLRLDTTNAPLTGVLTTLEDIKITVDDKKLFLGDADEGSMWWDSGGGLFIDAFQDDLNLTTTNTGNIKLTPAGANDVIITTQGAEQGLDVINTFTATNSLAQVNVANDVNTQGGIRVYGSTHLLTQFQNKVTWSAEGSMVFFPSRNTATGASGVIDFYAGGFNATEKRLELSKDGFKVVQDNFKQYFGAGDDASINYTGANLQMIPTEQGNGGFWIDGGGFDAADRSTSRNMGLIATHKTTDNFSNAWGAWIAGQYEGVSTSQVSAIGLNAFGYCTGSGDMTIQGSNGGLTGGLYETRHAGTGTVTEANDIIVRGWMNSTGTYTSHRGLKIVEMVNGGGGTITTNTGIYIEALSAASTNWGIYDLGNDWIIAADNKKMFWGATNRGSVYHDGTNLVINPDEVGSGKIKVNDTWTLPNVDGSTDDVLKTDGAGAATFATPTTDIPIALTLYDAEPSRASESNWNGGILELDNAASLSSGVPFVMSPKGSGKIIIVINAGGDMVGDITATGTSVDRNTGTQTASDTSVMTLTGVTTDSSTTDANGNVVHAFTKCYITDKWYTGVVTLTTADTAITDMDIYHVSFEQFNDSPNIVLDSFDANIFTTNVNAEFDSYLFCLAVTGDEADLILCSELHVGAVGGAKAQTALANKYFRLRKGNIAQAVDGTTDGVWADIHYSNSPAYVEDVTLKIWATKTQALTLT